MAISVLVLSGFAAAVIAPWLHRYAGRVSGWLLALLPLAMTGYLATYVEPIIAGQTFREAYPWAPSLGVAFSFYLDGLSLLFALIVTGIGVLVTIYSGGYLAGNPHLGRFYAFLLSFMASMLGVVLADNLLTLYVFWELTSLTSFLLIGFEHERAEARKAAWQALLVTSGGGLALLAGLLLLGQLAGTMELSGLESHGEQIRQHALYLPMLLLLLVGAFTKSAQFPFHFWLPSAMEAPTPVSTYLHSATMVKAGVYLIARLHPALGGTEAWWYAIVPVGMATMLVGGYLAICNTDLKRVLAYSTVSALGTLVLMIGIGTLHALQAAIVYLVAHALYKAALFLVAGNVAHETGVRHADRLGGLWRAMPISAVAGTLAALSLAGFVPFFGFVGKELLLESSLEAKQAWFLAAGIAIMGALSVTAACIVGWRVFFGKLPDTPKAPHEAPMSLWLGPLVTAAGGLACGLFPFLVAPGLGAAASSAVGATVPHAALELALWHGLTPALGLSAAGIAMGLILYAFWQPIRAINQRWNVLLRYGPAAWYDGVLGGMNWLAISQTRVLQSGYLRVYIMTILGTLVGLVGYALASGKRWNTSSLDTNVRFYEVVWACLLLVAAVTAVRSRTRLAAIAALGVVGYSVALVFILFGAPDPAMTQFAIETLTVILFVLVLYRLPRFAVLSPPWARTRDAVIALSAGATMTVLILTAIHYRAAEKVSQYYVEHSVQEAHGRNIVNVILVDFRGFDTLGEITVLVVAAIGVYALLRLRPRGERT